MVFITEQVIDHDDALGEMTNCIFPGHGNAAMHLDAFLGDFAARPPDQVFQC